MNETIENKFSSKYWFNILVYIIWGHALIPFVRPILNMLPVIKNFTEFIIPLIIIIPSILALPYFLKNLKLVYTQQ